MKIFDYLGFKRSIIELITIVLITCASPIKDELYIVREHTETSPISFNKIGNFHQIIEEFEVKLTINLSKFISSGDEILAKIESIRENFTSLEMLNNIKLKLELELENLRHLKRMRRRRFVDEAILPVVGEILKVSAGVLTLQDKHLLDLKISTLRDHQLPLIDQTNSLKDQTFMIFDELRRTIDIMNNISILTEAEFNERNLKYLTSNWELTVIEKLSQAVEGIKNVRESIDNILELKFDDRIFSLQQLEDIFVKLKGQLNNETMFPFDNIHEGLRKGFQSSFREGKLEVVFSLPAASKESWEVYNVKITPVVSGKYLKTLDVQAKYLMSLNDQLLTMKTLDACFNTSMLGWICNLENALLSPFTDDCVTGAYRNKTLHRCNSDLRLTEFNESIMMRQSSNEVLILTSQKANLNIFCHECFNETISINKSMIITFLKNCKVTLNHRTLLMITKHQRMIEIEAKAITVKFDAMKHNASDLIQLPEKDQSLMSSIGASIKNLNETKLETTRGSLFELNPMWRFALSVISCFASMFSLICCLCICVRRRY